jgi:hypothetical protein
MEPSVGPSTMPSNVRSGTPSVVPSNSQSPSQSPSSMPRDALVDFAIVPTAAPLTKCQGDCGKTSDCEVGLTWEAQWKRSRSTWLYNRGPRKWKGLRVKNWYAANDSMREKQHSYRGKGSNSTTTRPILLIMGG